MHLYILEDSIELSTESAIERAFVKKVLGLEKEGDWCVATRDTKPHGLISKQVFVTLERKGKVDGTS